MTKELVENVLASSNDQKYPRYPLVLKFNVTLGRPLRLHGWASAELPRNRVNVNLFLRHIRDLAR